MPVKTTLSDEQWHARLQLALELIWTQCTTSMQRSRHESEVIQRERRKDEVLRALEERRE